MAVDKESSNRYSIANISETRSRRQAELREKRLRELEFGYIKTITCILCPNSCEIDEELKGGKCEKGAEYAKAEMTKPTRVLTSSVKAAGRASQLVSVRTTKPISKEKLKEGARSLRELVVSPPIYQGDLICKDFIENGVDLIATSELL